MRIFFLHGRLYSPEGDGGGGGGAAPATNDGGSAPAGGGPATPDTATLPTASEQRQADTNDLLGGLPPGFGQPAPTVETKTADTPPAEKTPSTPPPATNDTPPPVVPTLDFKTIGGGKYDNAEALNAALAAAETTSATLADPQVQAFVEMAKDPAKAAQFFREIGRDYAAEVQTDPKAVLFEQYRADNPDYSEKGARARFEKEYRERYPNIDIADEADEYYQESALLRDEDAQIAAKKRTAAQQAQKEKLLSDLPKLAPAAPASMAVVSDAEIAAHVANAQKAVSSLTARSVKVDVLDANGVKTGEETVALDLSPEAGKQVEEFITDTYGFFEKAGITDDKGNFNYDAYRDFGYKAINYDRDIQAAVQRGRALGAQAAAAALIKPNDNPNAQPNNTQQAAPGAPGTSQKSSYQERQAQLAQNISDF